LGLDDGAGLSTSGEVTTSAGIGEAEGRGMGSSFLNFATSSSNFKRNHGPSTTVVVMNMTLFLHNMLFLFLM
jgi:hypothetical protein